MEEGYSKYGGRLYNSLLHFTGIDYHTTHDSHVFSMAVRSEASTGITGQMQTPDRTAFIATWHTGLKTVDSTGGIEVTVSRS